MRLSFYKLFWFLGRLSVHFSRGDNWVLGTRNGDNEPTGSLPFSVTSLYFLELCQVHAVKFSKKCCWGSFVFKYLGILSEECTYPPIMGENYNRNAAWHVLPRSHRNTICSNKYIKDLFYNSTTTFKVINFCETRLTISCIISYCTLWSSYLVGVVCWCQMKRHSFY